MAERDIRELDVSMLRTFDALMRERSVSRAAERLFLSQPAVSASLNRLRRLFDDPLFTRTAHGVVPTPRALALAPRVENVLERLNALLQSARAFDPATSDRIFRMSGSDYIGQLLLPVLARRLSALGSRARVVFEQAQLATLAQRLQKGDLDIAVLPSEWPLARVESDLLYEDHFVFVARRGHPLFAEGVTLESFCEAPQVFFGYGASGLEGMTDDILRAMGRERFVQLAVSSFGQLASILEHTDLAAVIPSRVASLHAARLSVHPLPFDMPPYKLFMCWNPRTSGDPGLQWLRAELRRAAQVTGGERAGIDETGSPMSDGAGL